MSIKVIVDNSPEGLEIKKALEQERLQNILYHSFVIRWGNCTDDVYGRIVFNSPQSIKNAADKENVSMTLMKYHVKCPRIIVPDSTSYFPVLGRKYRHQDGSDIRLLDNIDECRAYDCDYFLEYLDIVKEYQVHVMDLNVFYIEEKYLENAEAQDEPVIRSRAYGWKLKRTDLAWLLQEELKSVEELAVKAVHSVGLDFGVVNMARTADGQYYVLDVDAACRWMSEDCLAAYIEQFTETLIKYNSLLFSKQDITIGADVECIIKNNDTGTLVFASDFFPKGGPAGLDNRSIESGRKHFPLLEIRPSYSTSPLEVVDSIQSIMKDISEHIYYTNTGIYAGSMPVYNYWVGGHIHFGIRPNSKLLKALDNFLALPVMMIEKVYSARNRRGRYGELGNFRLKPHGFEYRSLASWIINPETARGVLCLAKVIIQEYLNLGEEFLSSYYDITAYYSVNKSYFMNRIRSIINSIAGTATFKLYSPYIEPLFYRITACKEWDEDKPVNEAWGMIPNGNIFRPSEKCFIPKKRREQLGIQLEDIVEVMVGVQKYRLKVYPKDDFSAEKNSYGSFSGDICADAGIGENDSLDLWFDSRSNSLRAGPVLGILADIDQTEKGLFGRNSYYFRKLIKLAKSKGMAAFVFTIYDMEWGREWVKGYTYDFSGSEWITLYFPVPDVIYDRGKIINRKNYGEYAVRFIDIIKRMKIRLINSFECINLLSDRWRTILLMNSSNVLKEYLLRSFKFLYDTQIPSYMRRYGSISIKPRDGSNGELTLSVKMTDDNNCEIIQNNCLEDEIVYEAGISDLVQVINNVIGQSGYIKSNFIIQCRPSLIEYRGRDLEFRAVMQKNGIGVWIRTCIALHCREEEEKFINIMNEYSISSTEGLRDCLGDRAEEVVGGIRKTSKDIAVFMDAMGFQIGELAIDFVIDENLNVFVSDITPKPDNVLSSVGAFKLRNIAVNRILEYAKFLVQKETKRV